MAQNLQDLIAVSREQNNSLRIKFINNSQVIRNMEKLANDIENNGELCVKFNLPVRVHKTENIGHYLENEVNSMNVHTRASLGKLHAIEELQGFVNRRSEYLTNINNAYNEYVEVDNAENVNNVNEMDDENYDNVVVVEDVEEDVVVIEDDDMDDDEVVVVNVVDDDVVNVVDDDMDDDEVEVVNVVDDDEVEVVNVVDDVNNSAWIRVRRDLF